jgi:Concanavalin A-like lectin/glucanases superfamily
MRLWPNATAQRLPKRLHKRMRIALSLFLFVGVSVLFTVSTAGAADTNQPPRLMVELRDGSRIIGTGTEKYFKFHSPLLGDVKMEVKDIRSVECVSSNLTKLTTVSGDNLSVSFVEPALTIKTGFGKINLAVDSVRKLTVSAVASSGSGPAGLVAFWSGNEEGKDSIGGNDAILTDIAYADGMDGRAFLFNGSSSMIKIPASQSIDLGAYDDGFTVMAWIKPSDVRGLHPIFCWLVNETWNDPLQVWIGMQPDENGVLRASLLGGAGNGSMLSNQGVLVPGVFQHIAFTYDKASGAGVLYVNGIAVAQNQFSPRMAARTKGDLWISWRDPRPGNWSTGRAFSGLMDDVALYNRALSATEIQGICIQENHGQPLEQPDASAGFQE